ncbi:hypothetical protein MTO96_028547 [Rhipicephalus appendiculatus]
MGRANSRRGERTSLSEQPATLCLQPGDVLFSHRRRHQFPFSGGGISLLPLLAFQIGQRAESGQRGNATPPSQPSNLRDRGDGGRCNHNGQGVLPLGISAAEMCVHCVSTRTA